LLLAFEISEYERSYCSQSEKRISHFIHVVSWIHPSHTDILLRVIKGSIYISKNKYRILVLIVLSVICCNSINQKLMDEVHQGEPKWAFPSELANSYLVPIGRISLDDKVEFYPDESPLDTKVYTDTTGSSWIVLSRTGNTTANSFKISMTNINDRIKHVNNASQDTFLWLDPSRMINSDNVSVRVVSSQLSQNREDRESMVMTIQRYVREHIQHVDFRRHFSKKAAETLVDGFGTCVNRTRVFLALCRASGIPARTIWGYFYVPPDMKTQGHHEWA